MCSALARIARQAPSSPRPGRGARRRPRPEPARHCARRGPGRRDPPRLRARSHLAGPRRREAAVAMWPLPSRAKMARAAPGAESPPPPAAGGAGWGCAGTGGRAGVLRRQWVASRAPAPKSPGDPGKRSLPPRTRDTRGAGARQRLRPRRKHCISSCVGRSSQPRPSWAEPLKRAACGERAGLNFPVVLLSSSTWDAAILLKRLFCNF